MKQSIFNKSFENKSLGTGVMSPSNSLPLLKEKTAFKKIQATYSDYNESVVSTQKVISSTSKFPKQQQYESKFNEDYHRLIDIDTR